jgi:hypothetical protein
LVIRISGILVTRGLGILESRSSKTSTRRKVPSWGQLLAYRIRRKSPLCGGQLLAYRRIGIREIDNPVGK